MMILGTLNALDASEWGRAHVKTFSVLGSILKDPNNKLELSYSYYVFHNIIIYHKVQYYVQ